jgi:hypothetical protein
MTHQKLSLGCWWLTPIILATQEAEIRRIAIQSQSRQVILGDPILKKSITKKGLAEWLKVKALSSNPSTTRVDTHTHTHTKFSLTYD